MANPEDLGRYRLKRLLGRGVLGEVWEATDLEQQGHKVAVKILHAADDELALARLQFAREARLSVHIRHPNMAHVLDAGEAAGTSFMVMEMVEGTPLRQLIGDASVSLTEKLRWLRQIGDAMVLMHRTDLIHRDLKPENVIIRADGSACLVDLGIAKWTKFDLGGERDLDDIEAMDAAEKKGPDTKYAPPETLTTEVYDELGDQWAWGTLGYELLTGKLPTDGAKPLKEIDEIPANVADAIDKARTANRQDRWDALEVALDEIGPGSRPPIRHEPSPSRAETAPPPAGISVMPASAGPPSSMGPPKTLHPVLLGIGILIVLGIIVAAVATLR